MGPVTGMEGSWGGAVEIVAWEESEEKSESEAFEFVFGGAV